jgi:hypothetical protein
MKRPKKRMSLERHISSVHEGKKCTPEPRNYLNVSYF